MKTAKEILDGKIYNRFDLARACEDVVRFFEESEASSKLIISGKQFDDIRPDADFYGYFMYQGDEAVNKLVNSRIAMEIIRKYKGKKHLLCILDDGTKESSRFTRILYGTLPEEAGPP